MKGFDAQFTDLPDYILKCTARIWEGRDIAALDWHYHDDLLVRSPSGISQGNTAGKANTMATLTEFPDRQLLAGTWSGVVTINPGSYLLTGFYQPQRITAVPLVLLLD